MNTSTPLMRQYQELKKEYLNALLFFQVGDFYELFFDDARQAASFLGITLTNRGKYNGEPVPLCGVPVHALDHYLTKLIRGGFKVAIADQLTDAKPGTIVERGVTKVLTPGTLTDSHLLDEKSASYLFSFYPMKDQWGLLFGELLTAQLFATCLPADSHKLLESELIRFFPDEVLLPNTDFATSFNNFFRHQGYCTTIVSRELELMEDGALRRWMHKQFDANVRRQIENNNALHRAFSSFYAYLHKNQHYALENFNTINLYSSSDFLMIDGPTQRNLELVKNNQDGSRKNTLLSIIDHALTGMGSRMIKKWVVRPLNTKESIQRRQDSIESLVMDNKCMYVIRTLLKQIGDIERIVGRIALHRATLQDYIALCTVLQVLPDIQNVLSSKQEIMLLHNIASYLIGFSPLKQLLYSALNTDFSLSWFIKKGFNQELDRMREYAEKRSGKMLDIERREREVSGISSLKIRYNKVHGYYIEITKANVRHVPDYFIKLQMLVGKERFVTPELQQVQHDILSANSNVEEIEKQLFNQVKLDVYQYVPLLRKMAHGLAHLDALWGLADLAYQNQYVRPELHEDGQIIINRGRHPVVEHALSKSFIPNDTLLSDDSTCWIITGPNMGGKSTYLRQVALITILAHMGSFVPAKSATITLLDRIFTRIGAGDNLAEGKSTFLVEMEEVATICKDATRNSLIILDEVGRGTSTFDGLALAHAIVEYLYTIVQARCLFATHYHELHQLSSENKGIVSYHAACKKQEEGILFLHTIVQGIADGSFGIEVAKIANLPDAIVKRSQELLTIFTTQKSGVTFQGPTMLTDEVIRLQEQNKILQAYIVKLKKRQEELTNLDYETLSPKQAFDLLWNWKETID